jgi:hypothetical protein
MMARNSQLATRNSQLLIDLLLLVGIEVFMMAFLDVRVLFYDTVPTGGDTASWQGVADHLLTVLLPQGRLTGWDLGNFCGYPNFSFYFLPPFLLAVLPSWLFGLPLTVTLKFAISLGVFLLPVMTYLGLRAMNYRFPGPVIGAAASLLFLFNESYTMFGGNILSTYTGEFCYMFAFALLALFMGTLYRGVETQSGTLGNGVLLGLIGLSHLFVFIPAICLVVYWFLAGGRLRYLVKVCLVAFGIMAFWILPLIAFRHPFTTPVYMIWQPFVSWRYTFLGLGLLLLFVGPRLALAALAGPARRPIPPNTGEAVKKCDAKASFSDCHFDQREKSDLHPQVILSKAKDRLALGRSLTSFGTMLRIRFLAPLEMTLFGPSSRLFQCFPLAKGGRDDFCANRWGLGMLVFSGLWVFTLAYLGATYAVLGRGLFDTGIEITPLSASPAGMEWALVLRPWIVPVSLFLALAAVAGGLAAFRNPHRYERFCWWSGNTALLLGLATAFFGLYAFMTPAVPDPWLRAFFLKGGTKGVLLCLLLVPTVYLLFFRRSLANLALRAASEARADRFGMFLGLAFGCVVFYFAAHYLEVPDIRFLPPLLFVLLLIFFVETQEPLLSLLGNWAKASAALLFVCAVIVSVLFITTKADNWFQYNNKGYEHRPGYPDFREANQYLKTAAADPLNAPRVGYEKCELYGPYGGDRVFESLPLFSGRQTMEGIHYASSQAARFMAFLQTAYSKDVKTPRSYVLSRLNPKALPAYFDLYNLSQLILMTDKGREAIATSPLFEKEASFGDISIYRYRDCDGRYVDVPRVRPVLFQGKDWPEDFFRWYKAGDHLDRLMIPEGYVKDEADRRLFPTRITSFQDLHRVAGEPLDRSDLRIETRLEHLRISFTTNRVGVPHLVKVSYYPNWQVKGARGVYPVSPHLMLVVPREREVVLTYGRTFWDRVGMAVSAVTLLLLGVWLLGAWFPALGAPEGLRWLGEALMPPALDRVADRVRPCVMWVVLGAAVLLIAGGAVSRNEPVRIYVRGYGEWKTGLDLLQAKKPDLARPHFEKAIEVMAPLVAARARHDHQDVIHCLLFTAQCREQLGEHGPAEKIYRIILEEYSYSRFVGEAYVKIGRLRRQGKDKLLGEGLGRLRAGDESGRVLVDEALDLSREALQYFEIALREDPYSVWADYARQDIRQERDWAHRVESMRKAGGKG